MPVVLRSRQALAAFNRNRMSGVLREAERLMEEATYELFTETVSQFSGAPGQPQGDSRKEWLRSERPFAKYWFDRPVSHFAGASPNPVGVLSGDLLNSLSYEFSSVGAIFRGASVSYGVDYLRYLLAPGGTETMVARMVSQHLAEWARIRMQRVSADMVIYMRSN